VDSKVGEDPSIDTLNRLTFGGTGAIGGGLNDSKVKTPAMSRKNLDVTEIKESMILDSYHQKNPSHTFYNNNKSILNNSSAQLRTTGSWSRFRGTTADWASKEEKYIEKHQIQQKEYERMLKRFTEEKARTRLKHEENQNEPPEFMKKMKLAEKDIKQLQGKKFNEDSRFVRRLRDFQAQKYEKAWKAHEWSQMNSVTVDKFISKKKGVRGGPLYNVSAMVRDPRDTEKSINSTKIKTEEQKDNAGKMLKSQSSKVLRKGESQMKTVSPRDGQKFLDFIKT